MANGTPDPHVCARPTEPVRSNVELAKSTQSAQEEKRPTRQRRSGKAHCVGFLAGFLVAVSEVASGQVSFPPEYFQEAPTGSHWQAGGICLEPFSSPAEVYACFLGVVAANGGSWNLQQTTYVFDSKGLASVGWSGTSQPSGVFGAGASRQDQDLWVNGAPATDPVGTPADGPRQCIRALQGHPCDVASGNKYLHERDYAGSGAFPVVVARTYNSMGMERSHLGRAVGRRWQFDFERRVVEQRYAGIAVTLAVRPNGRALAFREEAGAWVGPPDVSDRLERLVSGSGQTQGWKLFSTADDIVETYDASGKLVSLASRAGLTQTFTYSDSSTPPSIAPRAGLLIRIADPFERQLNFTYNAQARIVGMTDPAGGQFVYAYSTTGILTSVTYPDGNTRTYRYNEPGFVTGTDSAFRLTGIVDENSARHANYSYNSFKLTASELSAGADRRSFAYNANGTTTVTNAFGAASTFGFTLVQNVKRPASIAGAPCPSCGPAAQAFDSNAFLASRSDWNGNKTCYTHDARGLEELRVAGLPSSALCPFSGGLPTNARQVSTQWHPTYRLPMAVAEPKRITTNVYGDPIDPNPGNRGSVLSKTVQATNDADGGQGLSATPVGQPRIWTYTYNANGQVLTMDGPRTDAADVRTYTYYPNDDADFGRRGNVATITNALGQTTQVTAYNAHGQPLTMVDPNGLLTTLTYDARQRLTSRTVGIEATTYEYDGVGQMIKVMLPDGSFLSYSYDAAHRLTAIQDNLGNRIAYTLDVMGNRTREDVLDPASQLAQTRSRVYSNLDRLVQEIGGTNPALQITQYSYDNQGNVTIITDPLNRVTANAYDALNRLRQVTDPANGLTVYGYDGLDQLVSVSDPRSNTTAYTLDGLGNIAVQTGPDTGTTANTYDAAGNLITSTNAKGQSTSYTYDALNRVTRIVYNQATGTQLKQVDYAYDQGANGFGRLTSITESAAVATVLQATTYGYDQHGRGLSETRAIAGQPYTTAYAYDAAGRMTGMTYPSGRTTSYGFDALGRINRIETTGASQTQVVVQDVAYHPFGTPKAFTFGNLQPYGRGFDLDGRIATHTLADQTKVFSFDAGSRITGIAQQGNPANTNTYGYDALDRLTSAVLPTSTFGFGYDPVGNRLSKSTGGSTDAYTYSPTSNRLSAITGASGTRAYVHDANGSITGDGLNTYDYDARGRLVSAVSAAGTTSYQVNALGQRVRKTSSLGDTVFHYDAQGRLIAESTAAGVPVREYIWLGDQPVAMFVSQLAQDAEVVVDNTDAGFSALGTWPVSAAVSGYLGANYQTHEANGAPAGAVVVDNTDGGFSTLGTWPPSTAVEGYLGANYLAHAANGEEPAAIVVDNTAGSAVGTWSASTAVSGFFGTNYQAHAAGTGTDSFTWAGTLAQPGDYQVYARWTAHPNRATNAKYTVSHAAGQTTVTLNQQQNGGAWQLLGTFSFGAGAATVALSEQANGYVIADAVKWMPLGATPNTATWTPNVPTAKDYRVYARWTAHPNRATDAKYTITHAAGETTVTANQQQGGGAWNLLGTFALAPGAGHNVRLTDQANGYVIADAIRLDPVDGAMANSAAWSASLTPGQYEVYARWTAHPNRATDAKYTVSHATGQATVTVDQQQAGGTWNLLGTFSFGAGAQVTLTDQANGYVIADAVRFVPLGGQQTGSTLYYVHTDHLNTPRVVSNEAQQIVWRWDNIEPFGKSLPEENPSGLGTFEFNLRFPGQYFDAETGLFYNYFRDYDPQTGRYVQSDPIGLAGGINTYAYGRSNPLSFIDPLGLQVRGARLPTNQPSSGGSACLTGGSGCSRSYGDCVNACITDRVVDPATYAINLAVLGALNAAANTPLPFTLAAGATVTLPAAELGGAYLGGYIGAYLGGAAGAAKGVAVGFAAGSGVISGLAVASAGLAGYAIGSVGYCTTVCALDPCYY